MSGGYSQGGDSLPSGTALQILRRNSANTSAEYSALSSILPSGTALQVLRKNSANTDFEFATSSGSSTADKVFPSTTKSDNVTTRSITDSSFNSPNTLSASFNDSTTSTSNDISLAITSTSVGFYWRVLDTAYQSKIINSVSTYLTRQSYSGETGSSICRIRKVSDNSVVASSSTYSTSIPEGTKRYVTYTFTSATTPAESFYITIEGTVTPSWNLSGTTSGNTTVNSGNLTNISTGSFTDSYPTYFLYLDVDWANTSTTPNGVLNADKSNPSSYSHTQTGVNPCIRCDVGTTNTKDVVGLALYPNSATTVVNFKIEASSDLISWSRVKTVPYSLITNGAWNYIYFPRTASNYRYWRFVGTDATSKVMTLNQVALFYADPITTVLTNSVTSGGTTDTISNYTNLSTYSSDASTIRNNIYQLARKVQSLTEALTEMDRRHRNLDYTVTDNCTSLTGA